ncbi:MAG: redoxin domain-containing protein [Candidatus Melainabacteria bacterium]|nr:MAG: redoxin domain-containing protein [Candidatus Melainabacteria bacterium]
MSLPTWMSLLVAGSLAGGAAIAIVRAVISRKSVKKKMKAEAFAKEVSAVEFEALRIECDQLGKPLVLLFHADWCRACNLLWPTYHKVASELASRAEFVTIDVDAERPLARAMKCGSLPSIYVLKGPGDAVDISNGFLREEKLKEFLENAFSL